VFGRDASDEELLAVAQHYGFPTTLLDFSRSLRVAAFFATHRQSGHDEAIGIIYYMRADRGELAARGDLGARLSLGSFSLLNAARLHVGDVHVIEPELKVDDNRIERQQARFLADYHVHDLQQVAIDRLRFRQRPGVIFEDPARMVTATDLLQPDSPLAKLANDVRGAADARRRRPLSVGLASARLPVNPLVGSDGAHLFAHLRQAGDFFDDLRDFLDSKTLAEVTSIFDDYFSAARVNADAGESLGPATAARPTAVPIAVAVDRLAYATGTDGARLWATIFPELKPGPGDDLYGEPREAPLEVLETPGERVAVACALFLAAWEHLQHVGGSVARGLVLNARMALKP
jgi:hypothetical protein